jgi:hypothetical protein
MEKAKRARKAETLKQPSLRLRLRAPYLYPDQSAYESAMRQIRNHPQHFAVVNPMARPPSKSSFCESLRPHPNRATWACTLASL